MTLDCSHTFCEYCIERWKKYKPTCPICRKEYLTTTSTPVVDNLIEIFLSNQSEEVRQARHELVAHREQILADIAEVPSSRNDLDDFGDGDLDYSDNEIDRDFDGYYEDVVNDENSDEIDEAVNEDFGDSVNESDRDYHYDEEVDAHSDYLSDSANENDIYDDYIQEVAVYNEDSNDSANEFDDDNDYIEEVEVYNDVLDHSENENGGDDNDYTEEVEDFDYSAHEIDEDVYSDLF